MTFYTREELLNVWKAATDPSYHDPYIAAGDGGGLEAYNQGLAQLEMVSRAIETSTEAAFILPYSGQTAEPASGGSKARVMITVERSNDVFLPLIMGTNTTIEERAIDYSKTGTQRINTGRKYLFLTPVVFNPGERGPLYVECEAELIGYGYNYPHPHTLNVITQPGSDFENEHGTIKIVPATGSVYLVAANESDVPIPEHVGQTIEFIDGSNLGLIARVISYTGPDLTANPPIGGTIELERLWVIESTITGDIQEGETCRQTTTNAVGIVHRVSQGPGTKSCITIGIKTGSFALGSGLSITCDTSTAVIDCDNVLDPEIAVIYETVFVEEVNTASWRMRSWSNDWAVTVTNEERPNGGKAAILDQLGKERNISRVSGETDSQYRRRIARVGDVITPNAIKRGVNSVVSPYNFEVTVREPPGFEELPGFYLDVDAFDYDPTVVENDRFKWLFDFTEFRAFIVVHVPQLGWGDFGFSFDDYPDNALDLDTIALDGYPVTETTIYKRLHAAVDTRRAGGVGFILYRTPPDGFF